MGSRHPKPPKFEPMQEMYLDYGPELPALYQNTRMALLVRDPECLFAYWEIAYHEPEGSRRALRLVDLTRGTWSTIEVQERAGQWYFQVRPDSEYDVELGYFLGSNFVSCARSNRVRTPRRGAATAVGVGFEMTVAQLEWLRRISAEWRHVEERREYVGRSR